MGKRVERIKKICPHCKKIFLVRPCEVNKYNYCSPECKTAEKWKQCTCKVCGKQFMVRTSRKTAVYCSKECESQGRGKKETRTCRNCGNEFIVNISSDKLCCCDKCYKIWKKSHEMVLKKCDACGTDIMVPQWKIKHSKHFYCSPECSAKGSKTGKYVPCANCGNLVWKMKSNIHINVFCNQKCADEYREKNKMYNTCEQCDKKYYVKKNLKDISRFCSRKCMSEWQSIHWVGEENPHFNSEKSECPYCGKIIYIKPSDKELKMRKFCSRKCATAFYLMPENRTDKQKMSDHKLATEAINYIKPTMTAPHIAVNKMLDNLNISYENERIADYYSLDIYLTEKNLSIEINGGFWHADPRRYKTIKYPQQKLSVARDKSKLSYIKNKYGYTILTLWEKDITDSPDICSALIREYVDKDGVLDNYNSFNYHIENGKLKLNENLIVPYSKMECKDLPIDDNLNTNKKLAS